MKLISLDREKENLESLLEDLRSLIEANEIDCLVIGVLLKDGSERVACSGENIKLLGLTEIIRYDVFRKSLS